MTTQTDLDIHLDHPFDALVSYHYFPGDEPMAQLTHHGRLRLIADSGAFSAYTQGATIELNDYAAWLRKWHPYLYWAASLDVFGNPEATLANFRRLRDDFGLDTVPTIHIGTDATWIDAYARQGVDFLGLGGMVGMPKPNILRWLVHVLRYARDTHPQMRFHAWGMSTQSFLEKLPLYSVDSSGLLTQAYRYGTLPLWDPRHHRMTKIDMDGRTPFQYRRLLMDDYGVPPSIVATSHPGNRHLLVRLAARSAQHRATYLQQRHQVTAPTWGINPTHPALTGTRMHCVDRDPAHLSAAATPNNGPQIHAAGNITQLRDAATPNNSSPGARLHVTATKDKSLEHLATLTGTRTHIVSNITDFKRICTPLSEGDPLK